MVNKFNKILHPEIVLDKRGNEFFRQTYKHNLDQISIVDEGFLVDFSLQNLYLRNEIQLSHLCLCKKFLNEKPKVYHVSEEFIKNLIKIDRKLPLEYLPERFFGYISFGGDVLKDLDGVIEGAYVYIGSSKETTLGISHPEKKVGWISYIEKGTYNSSILGCELNKDTTVKDIIKELTYNGKPIDEKQLKISEIIYRVIFNIILYMNSYKPIVERIAPITELKKRGISVNSQKKLNKPINECTIPITFINRQFHGRVYSKDSTFVSSHLRWQRCGTNFENIKLIWVKEHERKLNSMELKDS